MKTIFLTEAMAFVQYVLFYFSCLLFVPLHVFFLCYVQKALLNVYVFEQADALTEEQIGGKYSSL